MNTLEAGAWISLLEARRRLAVGQVAIERLIEQGAVTVRRVPGSKPRLLASDVDAIAEASTSRRHTA
jgi:hypothetical protein